MISRPVLARSSHVSCFSLFCLQLFLCSGSLPNKSIEEVFFLICCNRSSSPVTVIFSIRWKLFRRLCRYEKIYRTSDRVLSLSTMALCSLASDPTPLPLKQMLCSGDCVEGYVIHQGILARLRVCHIDECFQVLWPIQRFLIKKLVFHAFKRPLICDRKAPVWKMSYDSGLKITDNQSGDLQSIFYRFSKMKPSLL